jgi:hypothetical protein
MQGDRKGPHSLKVQVIERVELFLHSGLDRSASRWLRHWRRIFPLAKLGSRKSTLQMESLHSAVMTSLHSALSLHSAQGVSCSVHVGINRFWEGYRRIVGEHVIHRISRRLLPRRRPEM